ncbi:MAG: Fic family protein [Bacteroidia bacterium]
MEQSLANILSQVDSKKKLLESLLPVPEKMDRKLWEKFRLEWNYNSNHIEGNTLTYGETKLLLLFDKTKGNHDLREYEEMKAHDVAVALIREWAKEERQLTEADIRQLNEIILVRDFWKDALTPGGDSTRRLIQVGSYKSQPNSVRLANGEIFDYASPEEVPLKMEELLNWYRREAHSYHPLEAAALFHYRLVLIHPFDDGNGRVCRLLMNYHLLRYGFPPVIIPSSDKKQYLDALNRADGGDIDAFVSYIAQLLLKSLEWNLKAARGESLDEPDDLDKRISILGRDLKGQEVYKVSKVEALGKTIDDNVVPSLEIVQSRLKKIGDFFLENSMSFHLQGTISQNSPALKVDDTDWKSDLYEMVVNAGDFDELEILYKFDGFKSSPNPFGLLAKLEWTFSNYKFGLGAKSIGVETKLKKYGEVFTMEEIRAVVDRIGNYLLDEIEKQHGK